MHRIDRETSGVLLFATSREMREAVMARWGEAEKTYLAVVEGRPEPASGTVDQPLRLEAGQQVTFNSDSVDEAQALPAASTAWVQGMLSVDDRPQWRVIQGGSKNYIEPLIAPFQERIRLAAGNVDLAIGVVPRRDLVAPPELP